MTSPDRKDQPQEDMQLQETEVRSQNLKELVDRLFEDNPSLKTTHSESSVEYPYNRVQVEAIYQDTAEGNRIIIHKETDLKSSADRGLRYEVNMNGLTPPQAAEDRVVLTQRIQHETEVTVGQGDSVIEFRTVYDFFANRESGQVTVQDEFMGKGSVKRVLIAHAPYGGTSPFSGMLPERLARRGLLPKEIAWVSNTVESAHTVSPNSPSKKA